MMHWHHPREATVMRRVAAGEKESGEGGMMPSFKCKDIGMDCAFEASADTEEELMRKVAEHGKEEHQMETMPPDLQEKVRAAIKA